MNKSPHFDLKAREEPLLISNLKKIFKKDGRAFMAVDNLTFGVGPTEAFGLLGMNGAGENINFKFSNEKNLNKDLYTFLSCKGKTTTIGILTGELSATSGEAFINGSNIKTERLKANRNLGFCPQFDYLPEFLTVRQAIELFANIRGVKPHAIHKNVTSFIEAFNLNEFKDKPVQNLRFNDIYLALVIDFLKTLIILFKLCD